MKPDWQVLSSIRSCVCVSICTCSHLAHMKPYHMYNTLPCYYAVHCARYNSLDQLLCVVCGQQIKSDILWISHLRSRKHLDTVTSLKARRNASSPLPPPPPSSSSSTHTSMNISQREEGQQRSFTSCPSSLAVTTRKREFPGDAGNVRNILFNGLFFRI